MKKLIQLTNESKNPRTKELVDLFLFSLHCGGMRFSDVCTLRWIEVDLNKKIIRHLQVKNHTKRPVVLNLLITSECMKIIERWTRKFDNFAYVQLPDDFDLDEYPKLKPTINSGRRPSFNPFKC